MSKPHRHQLITQAIQTVTEEAIAHHQVQMRKFDTWMGRFQNDFQFLNHKHYRKLYGRLHDAPFVVNGSMYMTPHSIQDVWARIRTSADWRELQTTLTFFNHQTGLKVYQYPTEAKARNHKFLFFTLLEFFACVILSGAADEEESRYCQLRQLIISLVK